MPAKVGKLLRSYAVGNRRILLDPALCAVGNDTSLFEPPYEVVEALRIGCVLPALLVTRSTFPDVPGVDRRISPDPRE